MWFDVEDYGKHLRKLRHNAELSLTDVANLLGVTRQAVSKWELNKSKPTQEHNKQLRAIYRSWQK